MVLPLENFIKSKIKTLNELKKIREKRKGELMVFASGCLDLVHPDHIEYLAWARTLGDYLLLAINSDESVKKLKGNDRPVFPLKDRIKLIGVIPYVDYIIVFNELDTVHIIKTLKPDIFARGKDYVLDKKDVVKGKKEMNQAERKAVESYGGKICFLNKQPRYSTTQLLKRIKNEF